MGDAKKTNFVLFFTHKYCMCLENKVNKNKVVACHVHDSKLFIHIRWQKIKITPIDAVTTENENIIIM